MANTLPGTPYVESSDLVANYPAVSESLAERIDEVGVLPFADSTARGTALPTPTEGQYSYLQDTNATEYWDGAAWVAAGVAPGLVHINTTAFSAVSGIAFNDVFTSDYENYLIVVSQVVGAGTDLSIRLRAAGSNNTASNYEYGRYYVGSQSSTAAGSTNSTTLTLFPFGDVITAVIAHGTIELFSPQLSIKTGYLTTNTGGNFNLTGGATTVTTSYDGFEFFANAGTISGTIRVYGYKNS